MNLGIAFMQARKMLSDVHVMYLSHTYEKDIDQESLFSSSFQFLFLQKRYHLLIYKHTCQIEAKNLSKKQLTQTSNSLYYSAISPFPLTSLLLIESGVNYLAEKDKTQGCKGNLGLMNTNISTLSEKIHFSFVIYIWFSFVLY